MTQEEGPPKDHAAPDFDEATGSRPRIEENIKSKSTWLRLLFMLVVLLLWSLSRIVTGAVIVLQFFWVLFTGESNQQLRHLGEQLARYTYQIIRYMTFNSDDRPFPFDLEWPSTRAVERDE